MKKRSLVVMAILTFVTLGIYNIYWECVVQDGLKSKTGEGFSGIVHFFLIFITFGIYDLYWQYAAGRRLEKLGGTKDNAWLYIILAVFGVGIINMFIMQNDINKFNDNVTTAE